MDGSRVPNAMQPCSPATVSSAAPALAPLLDHDPTIAIFTPRSEHYPVLHETFNRANTIRPAAVIRPGTEAQVSAAVQFCVSRGIAIAVLGAGNDVGTRSRVASSDGALIDLRDLCAITIDSGAGKASIGGGTSCKQLLEVLEANASSTPIPWAARLGYAGWASGGGYGILSSSLGLGVDHILGARIVMADGSVVDTDEGDKDDLLWALRGAGAGALGVVTELRVKIYPQRKMLAGFVSFPFTEAPTVFQALGELMAEDKSSKLTVELAVMNSPTGEGAILNFIVGWLLDEDKADLEKARGFISAFESSGTLLSSSVPETTAEAFVQIIPSPSNSEPLGFSVKSLSAKGWSSTLGTLLTKLPLPTPRSSIIIHSSLGRSTAVDPTACFNNREPHLVVCMGGAAPVGDEAGTKEAAEWADALFDSIEKSDIGLDFGYVNFAQNIKGNAAWFIGERNAARLEELKRKVDPKGVFSQGAPSLATPAK